MRVACFGYLMTVALAIWRKESMQRCNSKRRALGGNNYFLVI
jgi:hypothetical protein